ncbi:hypothetical protein BH10BAC6_BH10BAC6_14680 [soil metagenome]
MIALLTTLLLVSSTLSHAAKVPDSLPLKKIVVDSSTNHILDTRYRRMPLPSKIEMPYLAQLRERVQRTADLSDKDEMQTIVALNGWVSAQWKHDGRNVPPLSMNACQILDKTATGVRYNCEAFARVLSDVLIAHGIVARVIQLRTTDQAYGGPGQGHIAVEAWSNSLKKWIFLDPQMNGMVLRNSEPLNISEISTVESDGNRNELRFQCSGISVEKYEEFLLQHMGYLITLIKSGTRDVLLTLSLNGAEQFLTFQGLPASGTEFTTKSVDFYPPVNETSMSFFFDRLISFDSVMREYDVRTKEDYVRAMPLFAAVPKFKIGLENTMPWFDHYEVSIDGKQWTNTKGAELHWTLHEGRNSIQVRSVNSRQMAGLITTMHITYGNDGSSHVMPGASH